MTRGPAGCLVPRQKISRFPALYRTRVTPGTRLRDQRGIDREAGGRLRQSPQQKTPIRRRFSGSDGGRSVNLHTTASRSGSVTLADRDDEPLRARGGLRGPTPNLLGVGVRRSAAIRDLVDVPVVAVFDADHA